MANRDTLIDLLAGGLGTYEFHINHDEEDEFGFTSNVERTAPVAGVGFVRQIGSTSTPLIRWRGSILDHAQLAALMQFVGIAAGAYGPSRTIHLIDFSGSRFEVLFSSFLPTRQRVVNNPRGTTPLQKLQKWRYVAEFEVIKAISGWP